MEKRNFVTSARTVDNDDAVIESAASLFGKPRKAETDPFEKKASAEDEKSDRE